MYGDGLIVRSTIDREWVDIAGDIDALREDDLEDVPGRNVFPRRLTISRYRSREVFGICRSSVGLSESSPPTGIAGCSVRRRVISSSILASARHTPRRARSSSSGTWATALIVLAR